MKAYDEVDARLYTFLILVLDGAEWEASRYGCFNPWESGTCYPLNKRLGGPLQPAW
jgi:hypothetical protein